MRRGKKPLDALLVLAKASFGDRRRRSPARIAVTTLLFALPLAVLIYLLWPGPEQPPLLLAAFDQVALTGETIALSACVESLSEERTKAGLAGRDLYFHELQADWRERLATNRDGMATVRRSFPIAGAAVEIMVRYPGDGRRIPPGQAKARVFVWPPETAVLMVDAERTLADLDAASWWNKSNLDIRPRPSAVASLRAARAKYRIGYLSVGADRPSRYNKLRAWLERGWAPEHEQLPDGPVLSRACRSPEEGPAEFLREFVKDFNRRFRGPLVAVTGNGQNADLFHEAGWRTYLMNDAGDGPAGVTVIKSWAELNPLLP
jgi:hypothetical protein